MSNITTFAIQVAYLASHNVEASKEHCYQAFLKIIAKDQAFNTDPNPGKIAHALIMVLPPIAYASLEGDKLKDDTYVDIYVEAKNKLTSLTI